jgi:hypothetical protein
MQHLESQLDAADLELGSDILDEIDRIVPPGTTLATDDEGYRPPAILNATLRRRQP